MKILLVDDEPLLLGHLRKLVCDALPDAEVYAFQKAKEALTLSEREGIDIAFLDINMRVISGIDLAQQLQSLYPRINIIFCTGYTEYALDALDLNCSGYILKPVTREKIDAALSNLRYPQQDSAGKTASRKRVSFRCFGSFEVLLDGTPMRFRYGKTRELLAYLVDRGGALCTQGEIAAVLWEDDAHEEYLKSLRKDLLHTLEECGCEDILLKQRGKLAIVPEKVNCDFYDWHRGQGSPHSYTGEYMAQYSWAEYRNSFLQNAEI